MPNGIIAIAFSVHEMKNSTSLLYIFSLIDNTQREINESKNQGPIYAQFKFIYLFILTGIRCNFFSVLALVTVIRPLDGLCVCAWTRFQMTQNQSRVLEHNTAFIKISTKNCVYCVGRRDWFINMISNSFDLLHNKT